MSLPMLYFSVHNFNVYSVTFILWINGASIWRNNETAKINGQHLPVYIQRDSIFTVNDPMQFKKLYNIEK